MGQNYCTRPGRITFRSLVNRAAIKRRFPLALLRGHLSVRPGRFLKNRETRGYVTLIRRLPVVQSKVWGQRENE